MKVKFSRTLNIFFGILLIIGFSSCKSTRTTSTKKNSDPLTLEKLLELNRKSGPDFKFLTLKGTADADIQNGESKFSVSVSYKINISKDSMLWASVTKFGIEFMRMLVTTDSVMMRQFDNKEARRCGLDFFSGQTGIVPEFGMLQSIFTGMPWIMGEKTRLDSARGSSEDYKVNSNLNDFSLGWSFSEDSLRLKKTEVLKNDGQQQVSCSYQGYSISSGEVFPSQIIIISKAKDQLSTIELNHSSVFINGENVSFEFRIPPNYKIQPCGQKK